MKFARYLQDTQTPEWKRAYIDYRGLKKCIAAIRAEQEGSSPELDGKESPKVDHNKTSEDHAGPSRSNIRWANTKPQSEETAGSRHRSSTWVKRTSAALHITPTVRWSKSNPTNLPLERSTAMRALLPLHDLRSILTPREKKFFSYLDAQLEKVESFYSSREKELVSRMRVLQEQLRGLQDHRTIIHRTTTYNTTCTSAIANTLKLRLRSYPVMERPNADSHIELKKIPSLKGKSSSDTKGFGRPSTGSTIHTAYSTFSDTPTDVTFHDEQAQGETSNADENEKSGPSRHSEPDNYMYAKKKLKKAVLEHYRGLEILHNYRILNVTGFRKALKKFEKVTKIFSQEQYMTEKVDKSAFGSDKVLREMMKETQELFAHAFVRGDLRKAAKRLRGSPRTESHHFSTFRSGIFIGAGIPALASALYYSYLEETRDDIEAWDALLSIYGVLFVPVVFSMLVALNLVVWARSRVNYTFIFGLELRTRLDYREYVETPSFLFATLCSASWLSFAQVGSPRISPTVWPLVWLGLVTVTLFNPLPILSRPSRFWLLRTVGKLFLSGTKRVEFTDFWMGDQFCSLVYTLSNLSMFVCVYVQGFENWDTCRSGSSLWPVAFGLAILPSLIRLIQSIKRYADSGLNTHLINGGKYGSGIVSTLGYYLWRHQEGHYNNSLTLWLVLAIISSTYSFLWDVLMDWSLLKPRAKNFLLRNDLGYPNHKYLYYFAIVTNFFIRFAWLLYVPEQGPKMLIRSFIVGFLEMMRRVQWNFFRLENEHLGNMDQYRVTREVPLPYSFDGSGRYEDDDPEPIPSSTGETN